MYQLAGSHPGYIGHRETHPLLSQEVLHQHHTENVEVSLLLDEVDKASDALWNLPVGVVDKATLTLGNNRKVDLSRTMIFMASNMGAAEISSLITPRLRFRLQCAYNRPTASQGKPFTLDVAESARDFLLREGTDPNYSVRRAA